MPDANQPQWIACEFTPPKKSDWPFWLSDRGHFLSFWNAALPDGDLSGCHWKSAKGVAPSPPALPLSREEEDSDAYDAWLSAEAKKLPIGVFRLCDSWHAALARERNAILDMLPPAARNDVEFDQGARNFMKAVSDRCLPRP